MAFLANHPGVKTETVCGLFGFTRRQLMGALNDALMCGLPPYGPSDYVTAWVENDLVTMINADFLRKPLSLTVSEAVSLKVIIDDFLRSSPGVFREAAESLARKIDVFLGHDPARRESGGARSDKEAILEQALTECRTVEIRYYSRTTDRVTMRVVEPLAIVDLDGRWYLAAHCRLRRAERTFRLDRIMSAELLDEHFQRPDNIDPAKYLHAETWFRPYDAPEAVLTFEPEVARWAKERFNGAVVEEKDDGSVVCKVTLTDVASVADIICDFDGKVTVSSPDWARNEFLELIYRIRRLHGWSPPPTRGSQ
jgi:proteasome accessory factor C